MQKPNCLDVVAKRKNVEERRLSAREKEVLHLLADGNAPSEIAQALRLSLKTVQTYCWRLKQKLGSQNRTQLIREAVLLCNSETTGHFDESLKRVDSIEVRYFDLYGKLIATHKFRAQPTPRLGGSKTVNRRGPPGKSSLGFPACQTESIEKAREILLTALGSHPEEPTIHYNLACYECQLGNLSAAKQHLMKATEADNKFELMALDDQNLEPLWPEIGRLET